MYYSCHHSNSTGKRDNLESVIIGRSEKQATDKFIYRGCCSSILSSIWTISWENKSLHYNSESYLISVIFFCAHSESLLSIIVNCFGSAHQLTIFDWSHKESVFYLSRYDKQYVRHRNWFNCWYSFHILFVTLHLCFYLNKSLWYHKKKNLKLYEIIRRN